MSEPLPPPDGLARLSEQMGRLDERTRIIESQMKENMADLKGTINDKVEGLRSQIDTVAKTMVTKPEWAPYQKIIAAALAIILTAFMAQLVAKSFVATTSPQVVVITPSPTISSSVTP